MPLSKSSLHLFFDRFQRPQADLVSVSDSSDRSLLVVDDLDLLLRCCAFPWIVSSAIFGFLALEAADLEKSVLVWSISLKIG